MSQREAGAQGIGVGMLMSGDEDVFLARQQLQELSRLRLAPRAALRRDGRPGGRLHARFHKGGHKRHYSPVAKLSDTACAART